MSVDSCQDDEPKDIDFYSIGLKVGVFLPNEWSKRELHVKFVRIKLVWTAKAAKCTGFDAKIKTYEAYDKITCFSKIFAFLILNVLQKYII